MHERELLGFANRTVWLAVGKTGLLTFYLRTASLLVLTNLKLAIFSKGAKIKVTIGEIEAALNVFVVEHEAIEEGPILVVLFGLASSFAFKLCAFKAIIWVICLYPLCDCFHFRRQVLCVVREHLALGLFQIFNCLAWCVRFAPAGGVWDSLESNLGEHGR